VALNRRSYVITDGDARAANRSMLYPVGFSAADFGKPIVGVPHGHSTMTPCNAGVLSLVSRAVAQFGRNIAKPCIAVKGREGVAWRRCRSGNRMAQPRAARAPIQNN
jgi:dihydroxyacid dehydratase/phosphogluconate dehydratase